ncbi:type ISP restriction/modification enzyme [Burkholderia gladioli]|uniref:type ISP restriction/modification enzyme n=1 Tax=Burkholderia gladioli TaxID=28095 RepID=UPI0022DC5ECB|nr:type ISP restriction/modification enzyme [Burkholderia gladioli]MDA0576004.1 hypothetical protein [Burkholderia gladioli]MDA0604173.1 hypothetical protein [Burkholderia gladioli]
MRKRGRHLRIACIAVPLRLQAGIGSLAGLLELATQFRGTRCIVAGIFSPVVIALIPLHLEGGHVGGQSCWTSRSGTNAGLWTPRPQRPPTIDLPQTYESCRIVDVIPALPPVVSHWHLVRQLRPTLDAAYGYADNLAKELPRIPCVKSAAEFWAFSKAGRELADLHVNYETVETFPLQMEGGGLLLTDADYRVEKMRYGKNGKDKDLTTWIYNDKISVTGIPLEAYEYVINGKPALDWVVERQCVKTDKDSGIVNDANDYATETMNNPRYPLELFQRVVTVSLETMKIVKALPRLDLQKREPASVVSTLVEAG